MSGLTKEELKSALINHGVTPPPASARKDEFVALYEEHVAPIDKEAGDFSDDEVTISPKKKVSQTSVMSSASKSSKKGRKSKGGDVTTEEGSLVVGDVNVDEMDDDQLFTMLKENGVDVGPIVASTRPFYKKKLALILKGDSGDQSGVALNGTNGGEFSDTEPETEPEDDQPSVIVSPQVPEPRVSTRGGARSSASSKVSSPAAPTAVASPAPADLKTGLRKRIGVQDEVDLSLRNTPTPRRSIHTYKVTESTKQKIVIAANGVETRDTTYSVERTESRSEDGKPSFFSIKKVLVALVVLAAVLGALLYLSRQQDGMSVDSIMDSVQEAISGNPTAAPAVAAPPTPAAPPRDIPEQPAVADV